MANLRRFFRRRVYGSFRKQGKLIEMHLYETAPAISLHALLPWSPLARCGPPAAAASYNLRFFCSAQRALRLRQTTLPPNPEHFVNAAETARCRSFVRAAFFR
jgi:hypothetical protein